MTHACTENVQQSNEHNHKRVFAVTLILISILFHFLRARRPTKRLETTRKTRLNLHE